MGPAENLLDALLAEPSEPERDRLRDLLIARHPPEDLVEPLARRVGELHRPGAPDFLRLVEWVRDDGLFQAIAEEVRDRVDLSAEVAWLALQVLDDAGRLEGDSELKEKLQELDELAHDEDAIAELATQLDDDPEEVWVPLQALAHIEPEVRARIIAELAVWPLGPGQVEFMRLLAFAHDEATREAALVALVIQPNTNDDAVRAWTSIAADHPDPEVAARAQRWLGERGVMDEPTSVLVVRSRPRLRGCLVTAVDGEGRGDVVLAAVSEGREVVSAFHCDVMAGIVDVTGEVLDGPEEADAFLAELAARPERDAIDGCPDLAVGLLAGCLGLCGLAAPPALRYWIEQTVGSGFQARPFVGTVRDDELGAYAPEELRAWSVSILDTCGGWVDDSPLTRELARGLHLRAPDVPPHPVRDAGAYRFLFEHRLRDRLELYRRMLLWMASFWRGAGQEDLGRASLTIAWQLTDPAQAVPGHPFTVELTTRSLASCGRS
jgi:hypothetical protein